MENTKWTTELAAKGIGIDEKVDNDNERNFVNINAKLVK